MPNTTKDVTGYRYHGSGDDRDGQVCCILGRVSNPDILADAGPCYRIGFADGTVQAVVPGVFLTPWFSTDVLIA